MSRCHEKKSGTDRMSSPRRRMVMIAAGSPIKTVMFVGESRAVTAQATVVIGFGKGALVDIQNSF